MVSNSRPKIRWTKVPSKFVHASIRIDNDRTVAAGDAINPTGVAVQINDAEVETIGAGVIQGIDAAAMRMYLIYRHYEADVNLNNAGVVVATPELEDVDVIVGGSIIKF